METFVYDGEVVELGESAKTPFCDTVEAKRLALIEMQKGLAPIDKALVLDYMERCAELRLSKIFSGDELEAIREDIEVDLLVLDMILH